MRLLIISTVMTLSLTVILTPTLSYADNEGSYKIGSSGNMNITQNGINAKITAPPGSYINLSISNCIHTRTSRWDLEKIYASSVCFGEDAYSRTTMKVYCFCYCYSRNVDTRKFWLIDLENPLILI